jgi:hypothetical protein
VHPFGHLGFAFDPRQSQWFSKSIEVRRSRAEPIVYVASSRRYSVIPAARRRVRRKPYPIFARAVEIMRPESEYAATVLGADFRHTSNTAIMPSRCHGDARTCCPVPGAGPNRRESQKRCWCRIIPGHTPSIRGCRIGSTRSPSTPSASRPRPGERPARGPSRVAAGPASGGRSARRAEALLGLP